MYLGYKLFEKEWKQITVFKAVQVWKKKLRVWKYFIFVYQLFSQHPRGYNNALQTRSILINCVLLPPFYWWGAEIQKYLRFLNSCSKPVKDNGNSIPLFWILIVFEGKEKSFFSLINENGGDEAKKWKGSLAIVKFIPIKSSTLFMSVFKYVCLTCSLVTNIPQPLQVINFNVSLCLLKKFSAI